MYLLAYNVKPLKCVHLPPTCNEDMYYKRHGFLNPVTRNGNLRVDINHGTY